MWLLSLLCLGRKGKKDCPVKALPGAMERDPVAPTKQPMSIPTQSDEGIVHSSHSEAHARVRTCWAVAASGPVHTGDGSATLKLPLTRGEKGSRDREPDQRTERSADTGPGEISTDGLVENSLEPLGACLGDCRLLVALGLQCLCACLL